MPIVTVRRARLWLEPVKDQVSAGLMARGIAFDLLQMAKRVGPQCKAAEHKDLSGEKSLTLDCIAIDDRRSHQA